jgi:cytochrome b subunit of formate dehydrogenase
LYGKERNRFFDILRIPIFWMSMLFVGMSDGFIGAVRKLVYLLALLCFVVLVITGFVPRVVLGHEMSGYWMMVHSTAAPVFAACVAALAVMWAGKNVYDRTYWRWLWRKLGFEITGSGAKPYEVISKTLFWVIMGISLVMFLSIVLSMFKIFGTAEQKLLMSIHRYGAVSLLCAVVGHVYVLGRFAEREARG